MTALKIMREAGRRTIAERESTTTAGLIWARDAPWRRACRDAAREWVKGIINAIVLNIRGRLVTGNMLPVRNQPKVAISHTTRPPFWVATWTPAAMMPIATATTMVRRKMISAAPKLGWIGGIGKTVNPITK